MSCKESMRSACMPVFSLFARCVVLSPLLPSLISFRHSIGPLCSTRLPQVGFSTHGRPTLCKPAQMRRLSICINKPCTSVDVWQFPLFLRASSFWFEKNIVLVGFFNRKALLQFCRSVSLNALHRDVIYVRLRLLCSHITFCFCSFTHTLTPPLYLSFPSSPPQGQGWRKEGTKRHQGCTHHRVHHQHAQAYQGHVSYFARPSCTVCLKTLLRFCTCEGGF